MKVNSQMLYSELNLLLMASFIFQDYLLAIDCVTENIKCSDVMMLKKNACGVKTKLFAQKCQR